MTSERASDWIGRRIKEIRQRRGWTAAQLADRCAEIGAPEMTVQVVANIETGRRADGRRRRDVTADEMLILAYALRVPPDFLYLPIEGRDELEVTPSVRLSPLAASAWVAGDDDAWERLGPPGEAWADATEWWRSARPLAALRSLWTLLRALDDLAGDEDQIAAVLADSSMAPLEAIARAVDWLAASGLTPPALPPVVIAALRGPGSPLSRPVDYAGPLPASDGERP